MPIRIGGIVVELIADTDAFLRGFDKAGERANQFNRRLLQAAGAASAAASAGFGAVATQATLAASNIFRASQRLGVSAQFLSEWQGVVASAGVSAETFLGIIQDMNERIGDGVALMGGEAREAAKALGLSLDELAAAGPEQAFERIFAALADVEDQTLRTTLADKFFADAGQQLTGVIERGTEAIHKQREELRRLGVVIDGEAAAQAEELRQRMVELRRTGEGFTTQLTANFIPSLNNLTQAYLDNASAAETGADAGRFLGETLITLSKVASTVKEGFVGLGEFLGASAAAAVQLVEGNVERAETIMDDFGRRNRQRAEDLRQLFARLERPAEFNRRNFVFEGAQGNLDELNEVRNRILEADEAQKMWNEDVRTAQSLIQSLRSPVEVMLDQFTQYNDLLEKGLIDQEQYNRAVAASQEAFADATAALQDNNEENRRILRERQRELDQAQREADRAQEEAVRQAQDANRQIANVIGRPLQRVIEGTSSVSDAFAQMTTNILSHLSQLAVNEIFNSLFSRGGGVGTGQTGLGFGRIFDSLGGILGGFFAGNAQSGLNFRVPGSGGTDSQLVSFRATPGEQVNVTPPGPSGAAASGGGDVTVIQNLHFQGAPDPLSAQQVGAAAAIALQQSMARNG